MLAQPQEAMTLQTPPPAKTEDLSPTCIAFPQADPTFFLVGSEEGTIFPCHRYDRAGAKAGVDTRVSYRGHAAPVMSVAFHPARGPVDVREHLARGEHGPVLDPGHDPDAGVGAQHRAGEHGATAEDARFACDELRAGRGPDRQEGIAGDIAPGGVLVEGEGDDAFDGLTGQHGTATFLVPATR